MLLLVETLNGDASFLTLGSPSPSSLSLESAFKHSPRSSVRLAPAPQVEGSSNPQADSHSQSEMTSSCLGTLGAMQGLNKSHSKKDWTYEKSRMIDWSRIDPFLKKHAQKVNDYIEETFDRVSFPVT